MKNQHKINRRTFLKFAGGAAVIAGGGFLAQRFDVFGRAAKRLDRIANPRKIEAEFIRQIVTRDPSVSRTIMWQSEAAAVEWREVDAQEVQRAAATNEDFTDDGRAAVLHAAGIEGLTPGRRYEYRLVSGEEASEWRPLTTPAERDGFKALIFPDSQSSDYSVWRDVAQGAWQRNPDAGFFINMGDLVDNGEDHTQWDAWLSAVAPMIEQIPFAPVMGNHETYNRDWKVRLPEAYLHYFKTPTNASKAFDRYYYSFDYGDVHYIVLCTQQKELTGLKDGLITEQLAWVRRDLKAHRKRWNVVLMHKDVLQYRINGRPEREEGIDEENGRVWMPVFDELAIDVVFTAHLHTYRDRGHIYNFAKTPDKKGPLYILTGVAGNVRYPNLWIDHAFDEVTLPQPETDNYLTMEVTRDALEIACFLTDGTEMDRVRVTKR